MGIKLFGRIRAMILWVGWASPWLSWKDGHYWGWHRCICFGPLIIFSGLMTEAELIADAERGGAEMQS